MTQNEHYFQQARLYFPGGVNSPVRSFQKAGGSPLIATRAQGPYLWDSDGRRYIDFCGAWGAALLGHAHPEVVEAVQAQLSKGSLFGITNPFEISLAEQIRQAYPQVEKLRMINTGTEAVMSAIRLARAYTGRTKIIKFEGCYHGHQDSMLVNAGSGLLDIPTASSAGVPVRQVQDTLSLPFNHLSAFHQCLDLHPTDIAAVIVEPVPGNMGVIEPDPAFLQGLRDACTQHQILLIFDEVITGFRLSMGGAQQRFGIHADLTVWGKIMGGGFPAAAFGGKSEILNLLAPVGPVYQAGTYSGNPISMIAGATTLAVARREQVHARIEAFAQTFYEALDQSLLGAPVQVQRVGSMFSFFLSEDSVRTYPAVDPNALSIFADWHLDLRARGILLSPAYLEANFISAAHTVLDPFKLAQTLADSLLPHLEKKWFHPQKMKHA